MGCQLARTRSAAIAPSERKITNSGDAKSARMMQTAHSTLMAGEPTTLVKDRRSPNAAFVAFTLLCLATTVLIVVVTLLLPA
jgi:hypothetical protein